MIATAEPAAPRQASTQELLEHVSASRLIAFQTCRLKFYFRYVLRLTKAKTPALHVGSTVHSVLQKYNLMRWHSGTFDLKQLKQHFQKKWLEEQAEEKVTWDDGEEEGSKQSAWTMLETYFDQSPIDLKEKPEAVEVTVDADLASHGLPRLVGIIDLVREGGRIIDYKTSAQTPNSERVGHLNDTQLSCYGVLYREAVGRPESGFELHHLVKLKTPKIIVTSFGPMTEHQETRLFKIIESYVNGLQRGDWIPSPSPMACACCEFFNECRAWH
jgi:CRISPR/Cas system-associated exonuclease Cas4 (RecB family)